VNLTVKILSGQHEGAEEIATVRQNEKLSTSNSSECSDMVSESVKCFVYPLSSTLSVRLRAANILGCYLLALCFPHTHKIMNVRKNSGKEISLFYSHHTRYIKKYS